MNRAPLSARRKIHIKTINFESTINNFLRESIKLDSPQNHVSHNTREITVRPKSARTTYTTQSRLKSREDLRAGRRRAFEKSYEIQMEKSLKNARKEWDEEIRYKDWKTKRLMKTIEPKRNMEDKHILEDIVHERNSYYLDSMTQDEKASQNRISTLRTLPPEIRTNSRAKQQSFLWT